jgi:hypothetical protein
MSGAHGFNPGFSRSPPNRRNIGTFPACLEAARHKSLTRRSAELEFGDFSIEDTDGLPDARLRAGPRHQGFIDVRFVPR